MHQVAPIWIVQQTPEISNHCRLPDALDGRRTGSRLLLINSALARMLELLLPRRRLRVSSGSLGCSPLAFARTLSTSVRLTTPDNRPDMLAPGSWLAEIAKLGALLVDGVSGGSLPEPCRAGGDMWLFVLCTLNGGT